MNVAGESNWRHPRLIRFQMMKMSFSHDKVMQVNWQKEENRRVPVDMHREEKWFKVLRKGWRTFILGAMVDTTISVEI